jgi:magnesium-transporting ATPase (P-type)
VTRPEANATREPWRRTVAEVAADLGTDLTTGLSPDQAAAALIRFGPNRLDPGVAVPPWRKMLAQFADPLVYLLLAAVTVAAAVWVLVLTLIGVLLLVTVGTLVSQLPFGGGEALRRILLVPLLTFGVALAVWPVLARLIEPVRRSL